MLSSSNTQYIFLCNGDISDPLYRIYFASLSKALVEYGADVIFFREGGSHFPEIDNSKDLVVNFFYKDIWAHQFAKKIQGKSRILRVCFGSDIFSFDSYASANLIADLFVCPTKYHKKILETTVSKPTYVLIEAIDYLTNDKNLSSQCLSKLGLSWFGYPESYIKSMTSLEPVLQKALQKKLFDVFGVISKQTLRENLPSNFEFLEYSLEGVVNSLTSYRYTLLSHFPNDLSVNTLIKSENKAVFAIACGVIPLMSGTPSYEDFSLKYGLKDFTYDSPGSLYELIRSLSNYSDEAYRLQVRKTQGAVFRDYSYQSQLQSYLDILVDVTVKKNKIYFLPSIIQVVEPEIKFRFYWRQKKKRIINYLRKFFQ